MAHVTATIMDGIRLRERTGLDRPPPLPALSSPYRCPSTLASCHRPRVTDSPIPSARSSLSTGCECDATHWQLCLPGPRLSGDLHFRLSRSQVLTAQLSWVPGMEVAYPAYLAL